MFMPVCMEVEKGESFHREEDAFLLPCSWKEAVRHALEIGLCIAALQLEDIWLTCNPNASWGMYLAYGSGVFGLLSYLGRGMLQLLHWRRHTRDSVYYVRLTIENRHYVSLRRRIQTRAVFMMVIAAFHLLSGVLLFQNCHCLEKHEFHSPVVWNAVEQLQSLETACTWLDQLSICHVLILFHGFALGIIGLDLFMLSWWIESEYHLLKR